MARAFEQFVKTPRRKDQKKHSAAKNADRVPGLLNYPIDNDLSSLIINDDRVSDELASAIIDGGIVETMEGAATLNLTVQDESRALTHKGILVDWVKVNPPAVVVPIHAQKTVRVTPQSWDEVYCTLDERDFALVQVSKTGNQFALSFENRSVHEMRKYNKPKVWYRDVYTRAMVIKSMADEVRGYRIPFYAPELHKIQPIANSKQAPNVSQAKVLKGHGFAPRAPVTVKNVRASPQQESIIGRVIATGESMGASYKVLLSSIMTITQESDVSYLNSPSGYGPFSQLRNGAWPASVTDVEADAQAYFKKAIASDRQDPNQTPGALAQSVQQSAFPGAYSQWENEAKTTLTLWGTSTHGGTISFKEFNRFAFKRGLDGKREDSWTCGQRLASEVNWRLFCLDNTLYYVEENQLIQSKPWDTISESDEGIDTIDYEIDTGKKISECTVHAHIDRWAAPAGTVIVIEDEGPVEGRWLVHEVDRPLFQSVAEITLRLPTPPLPEPAPTTHTVTLRGSAVRNPQSGSKGVDEVYAEALRISDKNYPYVWGGGHATIGVASTGSGAGQVGFDCSGYVSACLHAAGWLETPQTSSGLEQWGDPGQGQIMTVWANAGHTFIEFKFPHSSHVKDKHCQANTSPGPGPKVIPWGSNGAADAASGSFVARHWPGT